MTNDSLYLSISFLGLLFLANIISGSVNKSLKSSQKCGGGGCGLPAAPAEVCRQTGHAGAAALVDALAGQSARRRGADGGEGG